jgi:hypothetical protein
MEPVSVYLRNGLSKSEWQNLKYELRAIPVVV